MNDLQRHYARFDGAVAAAVQETLASGWWLNGPKTAAFAEAFANAVGVRECVPVANGSDALELALRALTAAHAADRDEVVTVPNAGGYTTIACRILGLVPVYADIEPGSQLLALDSAVAALSERTAAVVATHLYGGVVDVTALRARLDAAGYTHVAILEDCAQAHGATIGGIAVGTMGAIATFSFYPTKNLGAMGDAGAILTADSELAARVRRLAQYGWDGKYRIADAGGRNSRMDEVQAAILSVLLPHLGEANAARRGILQRYRDAAPEGMSFADGGDGAVAHLAVARTPLRERFRAFMSEAGIATDIHYPILDCDQPGWTPLPQRIAPGGIEAARQSVREIVTVPCFPAMERTEIDRVAASLSAWRP